MELFEKYPDLPISIIISFSETIPNPDSNSIRFKKVIEFCTEYTKEKELQSFIQPRDVVSVCEKLVMNSQLSCLHREGIDGMQNQYSCILKDPAFKTDKDRQLSINHIYSFMVYGFPYIYKEFKNIVHPIVNIDISGDSALGTCFEFQNGLITAKHNFEKAKKISIRGFEKEQLQKAKYYEHENSELDIIYIEFENFNPKKIIFHTEAKVLDDVMTMGFPNISGYHNFIAAEKAIVSSRITATTGQLTAKAEDIWIKEQLMLITARVKGGNSGGPVINSLGSVVGVVISEPIGKGNYDDLGYGTAIPMTLIYNDILTKQKAVEWSSSKIEFIDFVE